MASQVRSKVSENGPIGFPMPQGLVLDGFPRPQIPGTDTTNIKSIFSEPNQILPKLYLPKMPQLAILNTHVTPRGLVMVPMNFLQPKTWV